MRAPIYNYIPSERVETCKPVNRLDYIERACMGKCVLDLGALDETARASKDQTNWLHARIGKVATSLVGVDNSDQLPDVGLATGFSRIIRADVYKMTCDIAPGCDVVVGGELLEHVSDAVSLLDHLRVTFPTCRIIATTPNATGLTNVLLALTRRESMHRDHVAIFSHKSLATVAYKAGFSAFRIIPYKVDYPEAMERDPGAKRNAIRALKLSVNSVESLFPLLSNGLILDIDPQTMAV